jgi:hypothetical protein
MGGEGIMGTKTYHAYENERFYASDGDLQRWAADPNCIEKDECAPALLDRQEKRQTSRAAKRQELEDNPFDHRTEVSADAKHIAHKIVMHMWILFVALPVMLGILFAILTSK